MQVQKYAKMWLQMHDAFKENPKQNDMLFFNATAVIIVAANSDVNGALASSNMELMTNALGLGTFFSGFLVRAASYNKNILDYLGIEEGGSGQLPPSYLMGVLVSFNSKFLSGTTDNMGNQ